MKLTIGIATYNRNTMLKNLLMSILGLTRDHDIEVLVANDGGEGGNIIKNFCGMLTKAGMDIKFFDFKENRNVFWMRYELLSRATGSLFMFIDDDDFMDTITLHRWLDNIHYHLDTEHESYPEYIAGIDAFVFNLEEFHHRANNPAVEYHNRREYYSTKTKLPYSLNAVIYNLDKLRDNLPLLLENIQKIEDHKKNIGEDVFCAYWLLGGKEAKPNVKLEQGTITILNYDMTNEHMAFVNRDTNYVPGVNSMRRYVPYGKSLENK